MTTHDTFSASFAPIELHPDNPRYFLFRGKPTVLVTSGEHYGAVLNLDFDYHTYLDTLASDGLNLTRIITGQFCETPQTIPWVGNENTLAPRAGRFCTPWLPTGDGTTFDLFQWNEAYFARLVDFCREAGKRNIVVEVSLFSVQFIAENWARSPLYAPNNNGVCGDISYTRYNTLDDEAMVQHQEAMVQETVRQLARFDNVYYEITNEPYWGLGIPADTPMRSPLVAPEVVAWENRMIRALREAEQNAHLPRHLIALNIANVSATVTNPHPDVSILNFHYASPPTAVAANRDFPGVIAFDETSNGTEALARRREAWAFLLAGGAVYDNLDWSFAISDPRGAGAVLQAERRYDGRPVRHQLGVLKRFMDGLDFLHLTPAPENIFVAQEEKDTPLPAYLLALRGSEYAAYLGASNAESLTISDVPSGNYVGGWTHPENGSLTPVSLRAHPGGDATFLVPPYHDDIALHLRRAEPLAVTGETTP